MIRLIPLVVTGVLLGSGARAADQPAVADPPPEAVAAPAITVRAAPHDGFGRVVFDVSPDVRYRLKRTGDSVVIRFPDATVLKAAPTPPNNVRALRIAGAQAEIDVVPGARLREMRVNGRVVIDVLDPAGPLPAPPPIAPLAPVPPNPAGPTATPAEPPPAPPVAPAQPAPAQTTPNQEPAAAPARPRDTADAATPPRPAKVTPPPPAAPQELSFSVPMQSTAGAAMFQHGDTTYVVFDERRTLDLTAVRANPAFAAVTTRELSAGTVIALQPPAATSVTLTPGRRGWKIACQPAPVPDRPATRPISLTASADKLTLAAEEPGAVVTMADPDSGATLLIGTVRKAGQGVPGGLRTPEFVVSPTLRGVVVEPLSDTVGLRVVPGGFTLSGDPEGLVITTATPSTEAIAAARHLTRRFNLPTYAADALKAHLARGIADTAATPPGARGPKRRAVAATMLALGMAAEAQALLRVAAEQDPKEAASPDTKGLAAIAALLAGRPDEAAGISDPTLDGTDEVTFWQAVLAATRDEGAMDAASAFAATGPLALLYASGIRDRVLPTVLETMILGGQAPAAKRLLALAPDAPGLGFARALLRQADGDPAGALAALDALAAGRDRLDRARAGVRAVELRLANGQMDAAQAADALDKLRYAWRGDRRELALRERIADLRQRAGNWRAALAELRAAEQDFPKQAPAIHAHLATTFASLLDGDTTSALTPIDLIAMVDENAALLHDVPDASVLEEKLADRLLALDLPDRAAPLLQKLATAAPTGPEKAGLGARLAALHLHENDPAAALRALAASESPGLSGALTEQRAFLASGAHARQGDTAAAISDLAAIPGTAALSARAAIYEGAGDWHNARQTLAAYVADVVPDSGALDEAALRAVLRLATATARAGDTEALSALRMKFDNRIGSGALADTLRLLLADPVLGAGDVRRSGQEVGLARAVPAGLAAVTPPDAH